MEKNKFKIQIGGATFTGTIIKGKGQYLYSIERNGRAITHATVPSKQKDNIKLYILEALTIQAQYELSHELFKLDLNI